MFRKNSAITFIKDYLEIADMGFQQYTIKDKEATYTLEVELERRYNTEYERKEEIFGKVRKHSGCPFTYDESLSALKARGFERHLTPREFSQVVLTAISQGLKPENLEGVIKDILNPTKAMTSELEAEFKQAKYHKKVEDLGNREIQITEPTEEMSDELYDRWKKAFDHDNHLRHPEHTAVMLTAFGEPSRIVAHIEPQNVIYDRAKHKYIYSGEKVEAREIKEFPLRMGNKLKTDQRGPLGLRLVQGFLGRFAPADTQLPAVHLNATVKRINQLCPELVDFLWGYDYKTIETMAQKHKVGKRFLEKDSFVMSIEQEGDLVPVLMGSLIDTTPLYVLATNRHPTANSRGARVLNQPRF